MSVAVYKTLDGDPTLGTRGGLSVEPRHKGISFRAGSRPSRRTACGDTGRKAQNIEIGRDQNQTHWPKCACVIGSLDSTIYLPLIYYPQSLAANALTRQWIF